MSIYALNRNPMTTQLMNMRAQMEDLQRQLATQKKSETYGGLGTDRTLSVTFRSRVASIESYNDTTSQVNLRIKLLDSTLNRVGSIPGEVRGALDPNSYQIRLDGRTDGQKITRTSLDEMVGLLNAQADGRFLFSGKSTETRPVVSADVMLNGDGAKDGLKQITEDRLTADLGTGGLGRLGLSTAGSTVTIARQTPLSSEFGFKIADSEKSSSAITLTETGSPISSVDIAFTAVPAVGDTVTLDLTNPDGTSTRVALKATLNTSPAEGEFTIGADANATAANFQTALNRSLTTKVNTDLKAASAVRAGENFFDTLGGQAPQRVDTTSGGGTLATATTLRDGTDADTVHWYQGYDAAINGSDPTTLPRNDITARIDSSISVSYGLRANEDGFRKIIQSLAVVSNATFSNSVTDDEERYRSLVERSRDALAFTNGEESPADIHAQIATAGKIANDAAARHKINRSAMLELLDGVEGINKEDVAAQILTLQTRMQASYQTTSMLSQLSLVNYL